MNYRNASLDAVSMIAEYVDIQSYLVEMFKYKFPLSDWKLLLDCPEHGCFWAMGEEWKFYKHGVGIAFTGKRTGTFVDVHVGIEFYPQAFDFWRISQYFESIGVQQLMWNSHFFNVADEGGADALLHSMQKDCLLEIKLEKRILYILAGADKNNL